jgi:hypothetical protein
MLLNLSKPAIGLIVGILTLFVLGLFGFARCAHSATPYVQFSGGTTYVRGVAPVIDLAWTFRSSQSQRDFWKAGATLIGTSRFQGQDAPNNFAVRGLYVTGFGHFDVGFGLSWMQNPPPYNSSPVNFNLELGYRFQRLPVTFAVSHLSNAGTRPLNRGRGFLLLGWRFGVR